MAAAVPERFSPEHADFVVALLREALLGVATSREAQDRLALSEKRPGFLAVLLCVRKPHNHVEFYARG